MEGMDEEDESVLEAETVQLKDETGMPDSVETSKKTSAVQFQLKAHIDDLVDGRTTTAKTELVIGSTREVRTFLKFYYWKEEGVVTPQAVGALAGLGGEFRRDVRRAGRRDLGQGRGGWRVIP